MPKLFIDTEDLDIDSADQLMSDGGVPQDVSDLEPQTLEALRDAVAAALDDGGEEEDEDVAVDPTPFYVDELDPLKVDDVPTYTAFDLGRIATAALVSIACDQTVQVQLRLKAAGYISENREALASKGSN